MTLSGFQGETDYFSRQPEETLEEASATTRQWGRGRLSVKLQSGTMLLLLLLVTNLLLEANLRFPGEITRSLSTIEIRPDPGRWTTINLLGLDVDWLGGEGSQQVLLVLSRQTSSGRADLTWCRPAGDLGGRLFLMTWRPATPGETKTSGEDQGDLTRKITMRCWTLQKSNWKIW